MGTTIGIISTFNVQNLSAILCKEGADLEVNVKIAPFGQVIPLLMNPEDPFWSQELDALLIWTQPELISSEFARTIQFLDASPERRLDDAQQFSELLLQLPSSIKTILLPTWTPPDLFDGCPSISWDSEMGIGRALLDLNAHLMGQLDADTRFVVMDTMRWIASGGVDAQNSKLWFLTKTPYSIPVFESCAQDILACLRAIQGKRRKAVLVDLDNTLWGGVIGDVGMDGLRLGGHDGRGEAFVALQNELKRLQNRGIILGILSKNEESTALDTIENHREMILRRADFAGWRINWHDKAQNLESLVSELNIGLDSVVFLDDNPSERDRVRSAFPQVLVPELPKDPLEYPRLIRRLRCFDAPVISEEDRKRTELYRSERERRLEKTTVGSLDQWLHSLDLTVSVESIKEQSLARAIQLLNKTNQMNLSTRRMTESQISDWAQQAGRYLRVFRVEDKFGDYGLCGLGSLEWGSSGEAHLCDFLLSCRVMARGVEESMLYALAKIAKQQGAQTVLAKRSPTEKNKPCLDWFDALEMSRLEGDHYHIDLSKLKTSPKHINLRLDDEA